MMLTAMDGTSMFSLSISECNMFLLVHTYALPAFAAAVDQTATAAAVVLLLLLLLLLR